MLRDWLASKILKRCDALHRNIHSNMNRPMMEYFKTILLLVQRGKCGICGKQTIPCLSALDHDHLSGWPRGFLCMPCNSRAGVWDAHIPKLKNDAEKELYKKYYRYLMAKPYELLIRMLEDMEKEAQRKDAEATR